MKYLITLFSLLAIPAMAQQPFVEIWLTKDNEQTGFIRQICKDKIEALNLVDKYNTEFGAGQAVNARLHICNHDINKPCTVEELVGSKASYSKISTNVVEVVLKVPENKAETDNPVMFRVQATKATEESVLAKIIAEFNGKPVVTNKVPVSVEVTK